MVRKTCHVCKNKYKGDYHNHLLSCPGRLSDDDDDDDSEEEDLAPPPPLGEAVPLPMPQAQANAAALIPTPRATVHVPPATALAVNNRINSLRNIDYS